MCIKLLSQLLEKLQEHFAPFLAQIVSVAAPLLNSIHEDIRTHAISIFPQIIKAAGRAGAERSALLSLSGNTIAELLRLFEKEDNLDILISAIDSLNNTIIYTSADWRNKETPCAANVLQRFLQPDTMDSVADCIEITLRNAVQRRAVLKAQAQVTGEADEEDDEDEKIMAIDNVELFFNVSELISALFRSHGENFLPHFDKLLYSRVKTMAHPYCLIDDRIFSITVIGDLITFGIESGPAVAKYYPELLEILISTVSSAENSELRALSATGIGAAARRHPSSFVPFVAHGMMHLLYRKIMF